LWDEQEIKLENEKEEGTVEGREEGEVEELDYDESMEDLDLHPVGNIDEGGGGEARKLSTKQDERQGTVNWDDPQGDEVVDRASSIDDENLLDTETEEQTIATESKNDVNLCMKALWKPDYCIPLDLYRTAKASNAITAHLYKAFYGVILYLKLVVMKRLVEMEKTREMFILAHRYVFLLIERSPG
jgi:hypothetical protein